MNCYGVFRVKENFQVQIENLHRNKCIVSLEIRASVNTLQNNCLCSAEEGQMMQSLASSCAFLLG